MQKLALRISVFIAVFFSSIVGAQFFSISLNKLCIIPLLAVLLVANAKNGLGRANKTSIYLLLFYLVASASAFFSLFSPYSFIDQFMNRSLLFLIQSLLIYIPLILSASFFGKKRLLVNSLKKSILLACRIQVICALLEFAIFYLFGQEPVVSFLSLFYKEEAAVALINLGNNLILFRPTGINMDPAYLGIVILLGFVFERKGIWKAIYFFTACIAMSRVSIIAMAMVTILRLFMDKPKLTPKLLLSFFIIGILGISLLFGFSEQIGGLLARFNVQSVSSDVGTMRHILYIPESFGILFSKSNIIQFLIGFGPRQSGTIIAQLGTIDHLLLDEMFTTSWTSECDVSEVLLGYGVLGAIFYMLVVLQLRTYGKVGLVLMISILVYGIMYDISSSTLVSLTLIILLSCLRPGRRGSYCLDKGEYCGQIRYCN